MTKHTLFISDLHLSTDFPKATNTFFQFIKQQATKADALYILGDFFDKWIGDDDLTEYNVSIIDCLKSLSDTKVPIYIITGNHDFLLGKAFAEMAGVTLLRDPSTITLYGERTLITHGDILCTLDHSHQRYRKIYSNRVLQKLATMIPLKARRQIATKLRQTSVKRTKSLTNQIMDVTEQAVINSMQKFDTKLLIHGHTHRPAIHQHQVNGKIATRIVLDAWHDKGNYLIYNDNNKFSLLTCS